MTKYKLEYIWLDGYTPTPNLRGKTQIKEFARSRSSSSSRSGALTAVSTQQAEGHSSDCMLKPVAVYPDGARKNGALVMCEVMMPDGKTPHPSQHARHHSRRSRRLVRLRAGILLLQGRPSARLSRRQRFSGAAGPVLHRRRLQERRRHRPRDRGRAPRPLPRRRHQPRRHQRRSRQGPVGIPDLRQRLQERRRPDVDGPLPDAAPLRKATASTSNSTASRSATPTGTAPACTPTSRPSTCAKSAARNISRSSWPPSTRTCTDHIAVYGPDNHMRLTGLHETAVHRQVQLRRGRPRRLGPRAALASSTTATRAISKIAVRTRKATPTRSPRRS